MPHIPSARRAELDKTPVPLAPSELNYLITKLVMGFVGRYGVTYATINAVLGALTDAQQEFYLRVAVPYEEGKRRANGDVFDEP